MQSMRFERATRILFWALVAITSWFAFTPSDGPAEPTFGWDKADHLLAFGALATVLRWAYAAIGPLRAYASLIGYGAFIEIVQTQIPGRDASLEDLFADAVGAAGGLLLHLALVRWRHRPR